MSNKERIFKSPALVEGWDNIGKESRKVWWFTTTESYGKRYSLDKDGCPIWWDDQPFPVSAVRESTGDDTCTIILKLNKAKLLVLINKDMPRVLIQGKIKKEIGWDDYTINGLMAVKRHCQKHSMEAVIINPRIKTLEEFGVLKSIIKKVIAARDVLKGDGNEPASKKNTKNKANPEAKGFGPGGFPPDQHGCE
jgi:hypothetical protein